MYVQVSKILGRCIVQTFTTHVSNHLINFFPMCTECKKGQKPIKRLKTKNSLTLFVQNNEIIYLLIFFLGTGNKVLINVGLILVKWLKSEPYDNTAYILTQTKDD